MSSSNKGSRRRRRSRNEDEFIGAAGRSRDNTGENEQGDEAEEESEEQSILSDAQRMLLSSVNDAVEDMTRTLPDTIWLEWLWQTDPLQECHMDVMMNRMHLLGLIVARYRAKRLRQNPSRTMAQILLLAPSSSNGGTTTATTSTTTLCLFDCPVARYTLRQLGDTLENLKATTLFNLQM